MRSSNKQTNPIRRWFNKNIITIGLVGIVMASVGLGFELATFFSEDVQAETSKVETVKSVYYYDVPLSHELQDYMRTLCKKYDVPMDLVVAVIDTESSFNPNAVSSTDDYGLMQINICNHDSLSEKLGINDFLNPKENVHAGIYMLGRGLKSTQGRVSKALMIYNNGGTGAAKLWDQGVYSTEYTDKVMKNFEKYKESRSAEKTTKATKN